MLKFHFPHLCFRFMWWLYSILPPLCNFYTPFYFIGSTLGKLGPRVLLPLSCPVGGRWCWQVMWANYARRTRQHLAAMQRGISLPNYRSARLTLRLRIVRNKHENWSYFWREWALPTRAITTVVPPHSNIHTNKALQIRSEKVPNGRLT